MGRSTLNRIWSILWFCVSMGPGTLLLAQVPVADFTANITSGCSPLTVSFSDLSTNTPTQWNWDFGNSNNSSLQNPSAVYTIPGTYTVTLTATNGSGSDTEIKTAFITVFQSPVSSIGADTTYGCNPLSVQFSDQSTTGSGTINNWFWDFGDGNVSTAQNPLHTYILNGGFGVSLTITDNNGCQHTVLEANYINLSTPGSAGILGGPIDTCVFPLNVFFTDNSTSGSSPIVSWLWDFGDAGATSTSPNANHIYPSPGSYDVTLVVADSLGCSDTVVIVDYVDIIDFQADFVIDTLSSCPNFVLVFYDSTAPNPVSWDWDFGDGNSSPGQNPLYFYDTAGTYDVTLIATNAIGCVDSVTQTLNYNVPNGSFTVDTTRNCETPLAVNFTSTISGTAPLTYYWDFDDGTPSTNVPNPLHVYNIEGIFDPYLVVIDGLGCTDTFRLSEAPDSIQVIFPTANFTLIPEDGGCMPLTVDFTDTSFSSFGTVNSWSWNFGDPFSGVNNTSSLPNPVHTFDSVGIHSVELIIGTDWGCTDTAYVNVPVGIVPVLVDFTMSDTVICHNEVVNFSDLSTDSINNWLWIFGDSSSTSTLQNAMHMFGDTGAFTITLIAGHNGCNDTMEAILIVVPPQALFTVSPAVGCTTPHFATFSDFSIGADTWFWDFGDGFTSTDVNTTHTYTAPGAYTVSLGTTNSNGCGDTAFASVVIPDLQANFTTPDTIGCFTLNSDFTNTSIALYTPTVTFNNWVYGDGTSNGTGGISQFIHPYTDTGTFTVSLAMTDFYGCTDTIVRVDYIKVHGVYPGFTQNLNSGCAPLPVSFSDTSTGSLPIVSWVWDFGDNSALETTQNPTHIYNSAGVFSVKLTVADSNGCTDSITYINLITLTSPSPFFNYNTPVCIGQDIAIQDSSWGDGITYFWDFGDSSSTDSIANPLHGYADTGTYFLTLVLTDSNGCDSTLISTVVVAPTSTAGIVVDTLNSSCPPLVVSFQDSSSSDVVSWFWDFGDGATSANQNPTHTYSFPDTFDVMLAVVNAAGCVDTLLLPDLIEIGGPYGSFTFVPDSGCVPLLVSFQATASNTTSYTWDFGDGVIDSLSGNSAVHTYLDAGTPHPALILRDSLGCQQPAQPPDPDSLLIDNPVALFGSNTTTLYSTLCGLDTVYFFDSSSVALPFTSIISWNWDFGDGNTHTIPNPYNVYADTGIYTVVLEVVNTLGCIKFDSLIVTVLVDTLNILRASVPSFIDVFCGGDNTGSATGLALGGTVPHTYLWSDDSSQTTIQSTGLIAGMYTFSVVDSNGCVDTAYVTIGEPPILIATIFDSSFVTCNGLIDGTAEVAGTGGTGAYTYQWDDPGTQTNELATGLGVDTFTVTITDSIGCTAQDSVVIMEPGVLTVNNFSQVNVTCFGGDDGAAVATISGGTPPFTYSWSTTPTQTDTMIDTLVTGIYTISVEDSFGCNTNLAFNITEPPLLTAILAGTTEIECFNDTTGEAWINISGGVPNTGVPAYNVFWPSVGDSGTFADSLWAGTHAYQVTDASGCPFDDDVVLTQPPEIEITINIGDGTICVFGADSIKALATGGTGVLSYLWDNGLGTGTTWKKITPDTITTYIIQVTDANNCMVEDSVEIIVFELLKVGVSADTVCVGDDINVVVTILEGMDISYEYVWDFGDGVTETTTDLSATHVYPGTGNFLLGLTVVGPDSCVTDSVAFDSLVVLASPIAGISADPLIGTTTVPLIEFEDKSIGSVEGDTISSWYWDFGDGWNSDLADTNHFYEDSGTYIVTHSVVNELGCTDTVLTIIRIDPSFDIEVPTAFTPNLNGPSGGTYLPGLLDNDIFYPITKFVAEFHMTIFNRWGEMVYETFDLSIGWDGYYRGTLSQQDVYVWKIELTFINGTEYKEIGDVTLLR